nr:acyltransferase family protein [Polynucleobacter sp. IMCC30063]
MHPKYRPDIDGLRALAVLAVIGFHAFPELIPGGFIGVDVFFVISGFLISTILFENLAAQSFSFLDFYSRRIRRIFPALILVLVSCYLVGWFVLLPDEYGQLGKHMAGGAGFIQNWLLWGESGYFDNVAETKPLLHLWSLGIEEQFYIIWPILLWLAYRLRLNLLTLTILTGLISFALNIHGISVKQDLVATFYSPQTRFWELAIGAVLAYLLLYPSPRWQSSWEAGKRMLCRVVWADPQSPNTDAANLFSYLGLTLIVLGAALINKTSAFPGWWALLPTVGALLLLAAGPHAHLNRIILSNRLIVAIGLISYPLYLWHWAILSFLRILAGETPLWWQRALGLLIAVALSYLTYRFIEKPIRFGKSPKWQQRKTIALIIVMLAIGGVGYNTHARDGLAFRFSKWNFSLYDQQRHNEPIAVYGSLGEIKKKCDFVFGMQIAEQCYVSNPAYKHHMLLWGDSTAQMLAYGLMKNLPSDWQFNEVISSGCWPSPFQKVDNLQDYCDHSNYFAMQTIAKNKPDVVVISRRLQWNQEAFQVFYDQLQQLGIKKIIFVGNAPQWEIDLPSFVFRKMRRPITPRSLVGFDEVFIKKNQQIAAAWNYPNAEFINITDVFCNKAGCLVYIGDDVERGITSLDKFHLTPIASDYLAKELLVNKIISSPPNKN